MGLAAAVWAGAAADIERAAYYDPNALQARAQLALVRARAVADEAAELRALREIIRARTLLEDAQDLGPLVQQALAIATKRADADARAELMFAHALVQPFAQAGAAYDDALREAESTGQHFHLVRALVAYAQWDVSRGHHADAMQRLSRAAVLAQEEGDGFARSRVASAMANALFYANRYSAPRAVDLAERYRDALAMVDGNVYRVYAAGLANNLGLALRRQGQRGAARQALAQALDLARAIGFVALHRDILEALGEIDLDDDQPAAALQRLQQAIDPALGGSVSQRLVFDTALARADALSRLRDPHGAAVALQVAAAQVASLGEPRFRAAYEGMASRVQARAGNFEAAYRLLQRAHDAEREALLISNDALLTEWRARFDAERQERENAELRASERDNEVRRWQGWMALAGAVIVLGGTAITLRIRLHRKLRAATALKSAIVDHAMEAIVSVDAQARIVEFNPAAEAMVGWPRTSVLGQPYTMLLPERARAQHEEMFARLVRTPGTSTLLGRRVTLQAIDSRGRELAIEAIFWRADVGGAVHFTGALRDVTEQRRNAELIEHQRNELRQSEKLTTMGSLLASVAHELNNPLTILTGRAALMEEAGRGTPMAQEARRVLDAANRCARIVRTFLGMARQRAVARTQVQLNDVVLGAAEMLGYAMRTQGVRVDLKLEPRLSAVQADADQLGQVVLNLMVNAQQAMANQASPQLLTLRTGIGPGRVWLRVCDSGPGVSAELAERIFAPFFTTKSEGVGTGLGLSVSRGIAREHGGDLEFDGRGDHGGAAFLFWVPIDAPPGPVRAMQSAAAPAEAAASDGATILVVDDEAELAELMQTVLVAAGFHVEVADSSEAALDLLRRVAVNAVVTDLRMPGLDGAGLWRHLQRRYPTLARRVLFVTGDTLRGDVAVFLAEAGCPALAKPFEGPALVEQVRALLAVRP